MERYIIVRDCSECQHSYFDAYSKAKDCCTLVIKNRKHRRIYNFKKIPNWCTLPKLQRKS